jgi:hypothetical protein
MAVAQGEVPVAREPKDGTDRKDDDHVPVTRQREHG